MTEAFLLLGMTLITTSFWLQIQSKKPRNFDGYLFFLGCLIAMLSKGPAGIIMPCLPIFIYLVISKRWRELFQKFPIFTGSVAFLVLTLPWFLLAEAKYPGFLEYFFIGENFNRFTKPGWVGDKYGHAHKVTFGAIWPFFFCSVLPTSLVAIFKLKKIWQSTLFFLKNNSTQIEDDQFANSSQFNQIKSGSSLIECNHKFLFFLISLLTPLIFLTFMRNMIGTYGVYALMPFSVIVAMIIAQRNWQKFVRFLGYFSIATSLLLIGIFLLKPASLIQKLNYHAYLLSHLPKEAAQDKDLKLYYLGDGYANFTINWLAKDRTQNLNKENFLEISNSLPEKKYAIAALFDVLQLPLEYKEKMHKIVCVKKRETCLYEINS
jgi:4-amino-4-deoxy-L-arabinose transferase-like glycosyltransferase